MKILLLLSFFIFQSCSVVKYRLELRKEADIEYQECYAETKKDSLCRKKSHDNMNRKHEILMYIKEKNHS